MKPNKIQTLVLAPLQSVFQTKRLKSHSFTIVLLTTVLSFSSNATEMSKAETDKYLLSSCNAVKTTNDNEKTLPCILYIKGFFNGLLNAGNSDVAKIEKKSKKTSSLVERAYANRVGRRAQSTPLTEYCISVDELKVRILEGLSDDSLATFTSLEQLNSFLITELTTACSPGKK